MRSGNSPSLRDIKQLERTRDVDGLLQALDAVKASVSLRTAVTRALGQTRDPRAEAALISLVLGRNEHDDVRFRAAIELGAFHGPVVAQALAECLSDPSRRLQAWAALSLGQIGDETSIEPLTSLLKSKNTGVRASAVEALGSLGHPAAIEPLVGCLSDRRSVVRTEAAEALARLGDARTLELVSRAYHRQGLLTRLAMRNALRQLEEKVGAAAQAK